MAQINLDLTHPTGALRAMVGDVDTCDPIMSDMMYQTLFDTNSINDRDECAALWFAAVQAAEIIMAHYANDGQRSRERVNAVEVENYGGERYKNYKDLVKWLRNNPPNNCDMTGGLFQIGGTYNKCSTVYTLRYISNCCAACWPRAVINGYTFSCEEGTIYI